jgi:hypothetical protein
VNKKIITSEKMKVISNAVQVQWKVKVQVQVKGGKKTWGAPVILFFLLLSLALSLFFPGLTCPRPWAIMQGRKKGSVSVSVSVSKEIVVLF